MGSQEKFATQFQKWKVKQQVRFILNSAEKIQFSDKILA